MKRIKRIPGQLVLWRDYVRLSPTETKIAALVADLWDETGIVRLEQIMLAAGCSRHSARMHASRLSRKGLLEPTGDGGYWGYDCILHMRQASVI